MTTKKKPATKKRTKPKVPLSLVFDPVEREKRLAEWSATVKKPKPRTLARNAKGGKAGGEIVSRAYAKANPDTTVVERIGKIAWRGWVVVLPDGNLLSEAPGDSREMRFDSREKAVAWATQPGENVARAKVVVE